MTEQPGAPAPKPEPGSWREVEPVTASASGSFAAPAGASPSVDEGEAVATPVGEAPLTAAETSAPPRRKRRPLRWLGWSVAGLGVLALIGLSAYLVVVSRQWSDRVDELTVISQDLGQSVADARAAQADAEARMDIARVELENATSRISDLANEEAQAKDRESVLINYVDAMISCADSRQELINVLTDSRFFFPGKTSSQVEAELKTYCDGVTSDFTEFKEEIAQ